jgi:hypothetical protein
VVALPPAAWREIQQRAASTGITAELSDGGGTLSLRAELEPLDAEEGQDVGGGGVGE